MYIDGYTGSLVKKEKEKRIHEIEIRKESIIKINLQPGRQKTSRSSLIKENCQAINFRSITLYDSSSFYIYIYIYTGF